MIEDKDNITGKYILKGHEPVEEPNLYKWGQFMETGKRIVKQTVIKKHLVSTVFLGLDHNLNRPMRKVNKDYKPIIFETMIFDRSKEQKKIIDFQERYRTWDEAIEGHKKAVKLVKES